MSVGSTLLSLQDLDLELARDKVTLADMPELKQLASKRKTYLKLKSEMTKIYAQRKDFDIELEDLDRRQEDAEEGVSIAQRRASDSTDYRQVQDLELELSSYAKELDKVAFERKDVTAKREQAVAREKHAEEVIAKFEADVVKETKAARQKAADLQTAIDKNTRKREVLMQELPSQIVDEYERGLKTVRGIAVETLNGNTPSVCRMALQASSMDDLKHADEVARCPYCHRMLVLGDVAAEA